MKTILASTLLLWGTLAAAGEKSVRILCTGDVMMGGALTRVLDEHGPDHPYAFVRPLLEKADHVVINLENPVTARGTPWRGKKYTYRTAPRHVPALTAGKAGTATLANNHAMDFGALGLEDTLKHLDAAGILRVGAGKTAAEAAKPVTLVLDGRRFTFLAFAYTYPLESHARGKSPGTFFASVPAIKRETAAARAGADVLMVFIHAGVEYVHRVHPEQRDLARAAVDAGADAVIQNHSHVVQELEIYKGKPIVYSLGNFVFGTDNPKAEGALLGLNVHPDNTLTADLTMLEVNNRVAAYQPRPLAGDALTKALKKTFGAATGGWRREGDALLWP